MDKLRYTHRIEKKGIKFIYLSGPERSELYERASSLPGTDKPLSYMDNARRVANYFGIPIDTKTDTQRIKFSIHNSVQAMSSMLPIVVVPSAQADVDRDVTIVEGNTRRRMLCKGGRR